MLHALFPAARLPRWKGKSEKAKVSKKLVAKREKTVPIRATLSKAALPPSKMGPPRKISIVKVIRPRAKPGPQSMLEIGLVSAKPVLVPKNFCLQYVPASSHGIR
jgi:hypothetical protein